MTGYDVAEIREGAALITSKDPDAWADFWSEFGERHFAAGSAAEGTADRSRAQREYLVAFDFFSLARWPGPHTPRRRAAYLRSLEVFAAYDRLNEMPLQAITLGVGGTSEIMKECISRAL
jgi:hypothetical protein